VRVVSATHRDLEAMVREGTFREDLFYRLRGMVLRTPALSARTSDIAPLATRFLHRAAPGARFTTDALAWLQTQAWPGNVRQLRAVVEAAGALLTPGVDKVDAELLRFAAGSGPAPEVAAEPASEGAGMLDAAIAELETRLIGEAMKASGGNQSEAARRLGISRAGLIKKLGRLGLR
jgi:two-component system NtrC family response regulator